jgi:hypothetical protein
MPGTPILLFWTGLYRTKLNYISDENKSNELRMHGPLRSLIWYLFQHRQALYPTHTTNLPQ